MGISSRSWWDTEGRGMAGALDVRMKGGRSGCGSLGLVPQCTSQRPTPSSSLRYPLTSERARSNTANSRKSSIRLSPSSPLLVSSFTGIRLCARAQMHLLAGLPPEVLQGIIQTPSKENDEGKEEENTWQDSRLVLHASGSRVIYEFPNVVDHVEPRLHLYLNDDNVLQSYPAETTSTHSLGISMPFPISPHMLQVALSSAQDHITLDPFEDDGHFRVASVTSCVLYYPPL